MQLPNFLSRKSSPFVQQNVSCYAIRAGIKKTVEGVEKIF